MPLEAPVMRTSFDAMEGMSRTCKLNITAGAFALTSLPEFGVRKACAELWHKRYRPARTDRVRRQGAGNAPPPLYLIGSHLVRRGSLHEVVVRLYLHLG